MLNDLQQEVASERRKDIDLFLQAGENTSKANPKASTLFHLIEGCKGRYDVPPSDVFDEEGQMLRKRHTTPLQLEPGKQSLLESGAKHGLIDHLSPYLKLSQIKPDLLDARFVARPLPKPKMQQSK